MSGVGKSEQQQGSRGCLLLQHWQTCNYFNDSTHACDSCVETHKGILGSSHVSKRGGRRVSRRGTVPEPSQVVVRVLQVQNVPLLCGILVRCPAHWMNESMEIERK